jgi:hypothetical protein
MGAAAAGGKRRYRKIKVFLFDLAALVRALGE